MDEALKAYYEIEKDGFIGFSMVCFSDTILIYQDSEDELLREMAYAGIWTIAQLIYNKLLAIQIPIRGVISFGEFHVMNDSSNKNIIFFGDALVKAYEMEQKENWIGVIVTPEALYPGSESDIVRMRQSKSLLIRKDKCLMLNPFFMIRDYSGFEGDINAIEQKWRKGRLLIELKAFSFIHINASQFSLEYNYDKVAEKYLNTSLFIKEVMGENTYNWAVKLAKDLKYI